MAEGAPVVHGRLFGLPAWAAIGTLGAAGVIGYLLFFRQARPRTRGTTGYSQQALAVMQNPDESATMAIQNQLLSEIGNNVQSGFSTIGTSLNGISGQITDTQAALTAQNSSLLDTMRNQFNALFTQGAVGNQQSLEQLQTEFKQYAQNVYGYPSGLGGQAGYLALPNTWQDFQLFMQNPALASPQYQRELLNTRGYVFYPGGATASTLGTGAGGGLPATLSTPQTVPAL